MPIMPRFRGSLAGKQPMPRSVMATGRLPACTNWSNTRIAPETMMPWPARIKLRLFVVDALALGGKLRRGGVPVEIARGLLRVFGDIDEDGAGPAGICDQESFTNSAGNVFGAGNNHVVLCDRHGDAGDINFLEGIGAEELAADLSSDANHRRGVQHRGRDARDHVGGAWAGGGHSHAYAAAGSRISFGHVRGALFVAHEDVVQLGFAKRVVYGKNRAAWIPEDVANAKLGQRFTGNFRAGKL